jgi:hypothetical protein
MEDKDLQTNKQPQRELSFVPEQGNNALRINVIEGTNREFGSVYLGVRTGPGGWNAGYEDEARVALPEGFDLIVQQASYGYTGVKARVHEGYTLDVLIPNNDDPTKPNWQSLEGGNKEMIVNGDWGNLDKIEAVSKLWHADNMGNPGIRAGVLRITGQDGAVKYFVVGAKFSGRPDHWSVEAKMAEVEFVLHIAPKVDKPLLD